MDNTLDEYDDPVMYDIENRWAADDDFYLEIAQQVGGPVLDVACGTGRLTRAIAEAGIEVVGTDLSLPMLNHARQRSQISASSGFTPTAAPCSLAVSSSCC